MSQQSLFNHLDTQQEALSNTGSRTFDDQATKASINTDEVRRTRPADHIMLYREKDSSEVVGGVYQDDGPLFQNKSVFYTDNDGDIGMKAFSLDAYVDHVVRPTAEYFKAPWTQRHSLMGVLYSVAAQNNSNKAAVNDLGTVKDQVEKIADSPGKRTRLLSDPSFLNETMRCASFHKEDRFSEVMDRIAGDALGFRRFYAERPMRAREWLEDCQGIGYKTATMIGVTWDTATDQVPLDVWVARQMVGMGLDIDVTTAYNKARTVYERKWRPPEQLDGPAYKKAEKDLIEHTAENLPVDQDWLQDDNGLNGRMLASFYWSAPRLAKAGRLGQASISGSTLYGNIYA